MYYYVCQSHARCSLVLFQSFFLFSSWVCNVSRPNSFFSLDIFKYRLRGDGFVVMYLNQNWSHNTKQIALFLSFSLSLSFKLFLCVISFVDRYFLAAVVFILFLFSKNKTKKLNWAVLFYSNCVSNKKPFVFGKFPGYWSFILFLLLLLFFKKKSIFSFIWCRKKILLLFYFSFVFIYQIGTTIHRTEQPTFMGYNTVNGQRQKKRRRSR